jgi:actin related protein 2/3 complex subunit 3
LVDGEREGERDVDKMDVQMYEPPRDRQDAEILRQYMSQVRQELATRLLARVYDEGDAKPSKWWLSFTKRKFMGKGL